ncbi:metallothionein-like protein type 2 [Elaeis guineensis]|uniref:Metallothionein-like protein n=1 Tax=Elaeis guineensis var. tenera TaxID=51953 RepID=A0A6I9SDI9_ELAGV|nr:metallothionein-like protein type 2 [Elaeis guineensis]
MSCCGGNCGCGADCKCGSACVGICKTDPDIAEQRSTTTQTMIMGVAPQKGHSEGFEVTAGSEKGACKCGANCTCDPCNCERDTEASQEKAREIGRE